MQKILENTGFRLGHECDPSYVLEWVDENATVCDKNWRPLCFKSDWNDLGMCGGEI